MSFQSQFFKCKMIIIAFTFKNFRNKSDSINNLAQCLVHGRVVVTVILKDYIQMCMTSARKP